jgi:YidC/Oxa1 family membrane protein insertase
MDKQTTFGFVLIGLVLIIWMWVQAPPPEETGQAGPDTLEQLDTQTIDPAPARRMQPEPEAYTPLPVDRVDSLGRFFAHLQTGAEKVVVVKTDLYTAEITTRGGLIQKWELEQYKTWDKYPVQLIDFDGGGDLSLLFTSSDGKLVNTRDLYFESSFAAWETRELHGDEQQTIELVLRVDEQRRLIKRMTFTNGSYSFDVQWEFISMTDVITNYEYQVLWENGLRYAEKNSVDESNYAMAYAFSGGEVAEVDASSFDERESSDITGSTAWVAARNKYFAVALLAKDGVGQGAYVEGVREKLPDEGAKENYSLALKMPFRGGGRELVGVTVYLGPLDYDIVKSYGQGLEEMMNLGAAWVIRPIAEYVMIPLFSFLNTLIPNYGVVIIVFSIIIKIVLHPLSKTSMKSMRRMQALQPMMTEVREKHKDNPEKMNQQIMNLYKDYGVNPAAGCLPLLLQMPILFALWSVLRSSIELRQAGFALWIQDLSVPDVVLTLPFDIPVLGMSEVSGVALAMGATMFIQQKMTVTDPRQKAMVWLMPIMMTLIFNGLPSGLNLYYFVFNLLSIGQQMWLKKTHGNEPLRKVDRKKKGGGILGKITKDLPKMR